MIEQEKPVDPVDSMDFEDHLEHYLNIDDDNESPLGAAIFKDMYGISVDDVLNEDEDDDNIEVVKTK